MSTAYEHALQTALQALESASANGVFTVGLSSSLRRQLEEELRTVQEGHLPPRPLAVALSHQMFDSGRIDDDFSTALDGMLAAGKLAG